MGFYRVALRWVMTLQRTSFPSRLGLTLDLIRRHRGRAAARRMPQWLAATRQRHGELRLGHGPLPLCIVVERGLFGLHIHAKDFERTPEAELWVRGRGLWESPESRVLVTKK